MIVLNLVIGVIMNSMDESNAEMALEKEINRRKEKPEPIRDGIDDLHKQLDNLSREMSVIKKMLEQKNPKTWQSYYWIVTQPLSREQKDGSEMNYRQQMSESLT